MTVDLNKTIKGIRTDIFFLQIYLFYKIKLWFCPNVIHRNGGMMDVLGDLYHCENVMASHEQLVHMGEMYAYISLLLPWCNKISWSNRRGGGATSQNEKKTFCVNKRLPVNAYEK